MSRLSHVGGRTTAVLRSVASVRRPELSPRSIAIAAMALFLVVLLGSPLQNYLSRRSSVAAAQKQSGQLQSDVASLNQQIAQWNDPNYVQRQARARLQYVLPGQTLYTVLGPDGKASASGSDLTPLVTPSTATSWNTSLWASLQAADQAK